LSVFARTRNRRRRVVSLAALAGAAALAVSACGPAITLHTMPQEEASSAQIVSAHFGKKDIQYDARIRMRVDEGRFSEVVVVDEQGNEVPGSLGKGSTVWRSAPDALDFSKKYTVAASAVDLRGVEQERTAGFRTVEPVGELVADMYPYEGGTYGVGMPITVTFNHAVSDRAAVQEALEVETSREVVGAWHWDSDTTVSYRPREYWPANTDVKVNFNLRGVESADGIYGLDNTSQAFSIGSSTVSYVDARTHTMTVRRNGEVIRTLPITTGKPGWETRSGTKVVISKERLVVMDAATLGVDEDDDEYYRLDVPYAMRLTWSGEFVHGAPWSVASQGSENVSHGCVGMSLDNAAWYYNESKIGDVVQVAGTGRAQDLGNGITVWNESWETWQAGSAL